MITIYLDIDGVLANYIKAYRAFFKDRLLAEDNGVIPFQYTHNKAMFEEFVVNGGFSTLDVMPDAHSLVASLKELQSEYKLISIEILGSMGNISEALMHEICKQKSDWVRSTFEVDWHMNFVKHKGMKRLFAAPNRILIDDTLQNVLDFRHNYGKAVHYLAHAHDSCLNEVERVFTDLMSNPST